MDTTRIRTSNATLRSNAPGGGPHLMKSAAEPVQHDSSVSDVSWFAHAQGMIVRVAEHGIGNDDHIVRRFG